MVLTGEIKAEIVAGVDQASFNRAGKEIKKFGRDSKKDAEIKIKTDIAKAQLDLKALRRQLKATTGVNKIKVAVEVQDAQKKIRDLRKDLRKATGETSGFQQSLISMGTTLKLAAVGGILAAAKSIVSLGDNLEKSQIAFTTMLGSAEKAKDLLGELSEFAKTTPFELTGIRDTAKQLLAMGIAQEKVLPTLKSLGDVSAGLSVPLERLALAYGQVIAKGKLQGGELKQFTEAGVPLLAELAEMLGKSTAEIQDMITAGEISSDVVVEAFEKMSGAGGRFNDLMAKQSETLGGMWSNLIDSLSSVGEEIGTRLLPLMKTFVGILGETAAFFSDGLATPTVIAQIGQFNGEIARATTELDGMKSKLEDLEDGSLSFGEAIVGLRTTPTERAKQLREEIELQEEAIRSNENAVNDLKNTNEFVTESYDSLKNSLSDYDDLLKRGVITQEEYESASASVKQELVGLEEANRIASLSLEGTIETVDKLNDTRVDTSESRKQFELERASAIRDLEALVALAEGRAAQAGSVGEELKFIKQAINAQKALNKAKASVFVSSPSSPLAPKGGSGGSRKASDTAAKEQKKLEDIQAKALDKRKKFRDDLAKEDKKIFDNLADEVTKAYDKVGKSIEDTKDKIKNIDGDIASTQAKLDELNASGGADIATRAVEIKNELEEDDITPEKRLELTKELALAEKNITDEQFKRAQLLSEESDTEKLLREQEEAKAELENKLAALETQKLTEIQNLEDLNAEKVRIAKSFTEFFKSDIETREAAEIASAQRIAAARTRLFAGGAGSTDNSTSNSNNATTNNVTVNTRGQVDAEAALNNIINSP